MFSIALPASAKIGDTIDYCVNGIPERVELRADFLYVLPNDTAGAVSATVTERRIGVRSPAGHLAMHGEGIEECINYYCESDDGVVPVPDANGVITTLGGPVNGRGGLHPQPQCRDGFPQ